MITLDHARNVDAAFVAELLVTEGLVVAVVGEEKDDGVVEFIVGLELVEDVLDLFVGAAGAVVVGGPGALEAGGLGEVGRQGDGVVLELLTLADMAGVGLSSPEHDLSEPGLVLFWAGIPGVFGEGSDVLGGISLPAVLTDHIVFFRSDSVEFGAVVVEVVVILAAVEGEVSGLTHELGDGFDAFGEVNANVFRDDAVFPR